MRGADARCRRATIDASSVTATIIDGERDRAADSRRGARPMSTRLRAAGVAARARRRARRRQPVVDLLRARQDARRRRGRHAFGDDPPARRTSRRTNCCDSSQSSTPTRAGTAILVQLPLPPHIDESRRHRRRRAEKDVDGLQPDQRRAACFAASRPSSRARRTASSRCCCAPATIPRGSTSVICGRSNLVGKPLAGLLMQKARGGNATVTVCHTATPDIAELHAPARTS